MATNIELLIYLDSFVLGWIIVDYASNFLVSQGQNFTKIRFFGGSSFASAKGAILCAYLQVIIAMWVSINIQDYLSSQIIVAIAHLVPIFLFTLGIFHLYILAGLPYNITKKRASPSLILFVSAFLVYNQINNDLRFANWLSLLLKPAP